ncbi:hypothetical protein [Streptomyces sp. NPDC045369]|uniref:hypothetical protein n=1 Tax=Streptomyces sp. NPDC045369 TaxID=3155732 RepID=UPI0033EA3E57
MVTHSNEYDVATSVLVPVLVGGERVVWGASRELPGVFGEDRIRSCADLTMVVQSQGGVVARLIERLRIDVGGFRLLARERETGTLAGAVEWMRDAHFGLWRQYDEPWVACAYGQHVPPMVARPRGAVRSLSSERPSVADGSCGYRRAA